MTARAVRDEIFIRHSSVAVVTGSVIKVIKFTPMKVTKKMSLC